MSRFRGRKTQCPALREALCDWFVDMRTVFVKIPPNMIKKQAKHLSKKIFGKAREKGLWPDLPQITNIWVRNWRREYGVSLRKPNTKFKLSRATLILRAQHMWRANFRIRRLASVCLGVEMHLWGMGQKPL